MSYYGYHRTSTAEQHLDRGIIEKTQKNRGYFTSDLITI